jgi:predicted esterase
MKIKAYFIAILISIIATSSCSLTNEQLYETKSFYFEDKGDSLSAVLNVPKGIDLTKPFPLLIFVHGDGATNADNFGYYTYIWNILAENGIASMSWNKKGVEGSSGNWLTQSMLNRAEEVVSAIESIQEEHDQQFSSIGLIGFSQGAWVLPKVSTISKYPHYMISVSGAINWKRQSNYLTKKRLAGMAKNDKEIARAIEDNKESFTLFENSYAEYLLDAEKKCAELAQEDCAVISPDRFNFIKKNINSDNSADLINIEHPVFAMFGEDDLNVDSHESYTVFDSIFSKSKAQNFKIKMYPKASHGLLKSDQFNKLDPGLWFLMKMDFYGKDAFADEVLNDMVDFALKHKTPQDK